MAADNLDIFRKVIFRLPRLRDTFKLVVATGLLYGLIIFLLFTDRIDIAYEPLLAPLIGLFLFILPSVLASEAYSFSLPEYPRKWGYFLSVVNQLIIFLFTVLISLAGSFEVAWNIIWLGVSTLYASNFFILVLSNGPQYIKRISLLSILQPALILAGFHLILGSYFQITLTAYLFNLLVVLATGLALLTAFYLTEFLIGSNTPEISIFGLATALLQNRQEKLDLGRKVRPDVQTLEVENRSGLKTFLAPWVHPGPIQGFGGGKITTDIIEELNEDGEGFFLHVPSCHQMDPSDPGDSSKILEASEEVDKSSKASHLIKKDYGFCCFYGRRLGEQKIVYMEFEGFDDYDAAIFQEVIDKEDVLLIDLHNQTKSSNGKEMRYGTIKAEKARESLLDFIDELDDQELYNYRAGIDISADENPSMAMVEETGGQRTVIFGFEGNDTSQDILNLREDLGNHFDHALLFTTDTHASVHDLASKKHVDEKEMRQVIENAEKDVSEASTGFSVAKAQEMQFLCDDYFGIIHSINILVRLLPIALLFLYLLLVFWLL